jgi:hypothetical protein
VNISINTPYPGTETWLTEQRRLQTRDYRLFDIQHAVLPTKLPLDVFYRELLDTQWVLYRKHMNWRTTPKLARVLVAVRPGLATTQGPLILASSPYAKRGVLWTPTACTLASGDLQAKCTTPAWCITLDWLNGSGNKVGAAS